jgi:capsular exopolysaccharide synthesis family protein
MVHEYLGLDRNAGLTTALVGAADVDDLLQPWGQDNLYVLASGQIPPNPSELLGSDEMKHLIERLEQTFDTVVVDAPPLLPVTDAAVLSQHVGGVVVVVGTQKLKAQDLRKSLAALELVDANMLGVVLNRLPAKGPDAYSYSYYGPSEEAATKPGGRKQTAAAKDAGRARPVPDDFGRTVYDLDEARPHHFPAGRVSGRGPSVHSEE